MSSKQELEIEISDTGEVKINVVGAKGKSCLDITKDLEESLGVIKSFEKKAEFYQQEDKTDINVSGGLNNV